MVKIANISGCACVVLAALVHCATPPMTERKETFEAIKIGDDQRKIESTWGPTHAQNEEYASVTFKMLQYTRPDGRPDIFFTVNPRSGKIIGKSQWLYTGDTNYDLDTLKRTHFADMKWETYIPCHTWSDGDVILANRDHGIYIATEHGHASLVSWSTPELVSLRLKLLSERCPGLQR